MRQPESKTCPECGAHVHVFDERMGVAGGLDKEQAHCPRCGALVTEMMTDGYLRVVLVEGETTAASAANAMDGCSDSDRDMATCPECDICPYSGFENAG